MPAVIGADGITDFARHHAEDRLGELGHHFFRPEDSEGSPGFPGRFVGGIGSREFREVLAGSGPLGEAGREGAGGVLIGLRLRLEQDVAGFRLLPRLVLEEVAVVVALDLALPDRDLLGEDLLRKRQVADSPLFRNLERRRFGLVALACLRLRDLHVAAPAVHGQEPDIERGALVAAPVLLPQFEIGHVRRLGDQRAELLRHQVGPDGVLEVPRVQPGGAQHAEIGVPADEDPVLLKGGRGGDAGSDLGVRNLDSETFRFPDKHPAAHQFAHDLLRNPELARQGGREVTAALFLVHARHVPVAVQEGRRRDRFAVHPGDAAAHRGSGRISHEIREIEGDERQNDQPEQAGADEPADRPAVAEILEDHGNRPWYRRALPAGKPGRGNAACETVKTAASLVTSRMARLPPHFPSWPS